MPGYDKIAGWGGQKLIVGQNVRALERKPLTNETPDIAQEDEPSNEVLSNAAPPFADNSVDLSQYVKLDNGEYISADDYNSLEPQQQSIVKSYGIDALNNLNKLNAQLFKDTHYKLSDGSWVAKKDFDALPKEHQDILTGRGIEGYKLWSEAQRAQFEASHVKLDNGEYVTREMFDKLEPTDQNTLKQYGVEAFNAFAKTTYEAKKAEFESSHVQLDTGEWVDKQAFNDMRSDDERSLLKQLGIKDYNILQEQRQQIFENTHKMLPDGTWFTNEDFEAYGLDKLSDEDLQAIQDNGFNMWRQNHYFGGQVVYPPEQFDSSLGAAPPAAWNNPFVAANAGYWPSRATLLQMAGLPEDTTRVDYTPATGYTFTTKDNPAAQPVDAASYLGQIGAQMATAAAISKVKGGHIIDEELAPYSNSLGTQINGVKYLLENGGVDNPNAVSKLQDAIGKAATDATIAQIKSMGEPGIPNIVAFIDGKLAANGFSHADYVGAMTAKQYPNLDKERAKTLEILSIAKTAQKEYEDKYGVGVEAGSIASIYGSQVFSPARALAPDVSIKDISGNEWILGGVQALSLVALPMSLSSSAAANIVARSLMAGATGLSVAYTAREWNAMTPTERTFSVLVDAAMVASVVGEPFVKWLKTADFSGENLKGVSDFIRARVKGFYEGEGGYIKLQRDFQPTLQRDFQPSTPRVAVKDIQTAADVAEYYTRNPELIPDFIRKNTSKILEDAFKVKSEPAVTISKAPNIATTTGRRLTQSELTAARADAMRVATRKFAPGSPFNDLVKLPSGEYVRKADLLAKEVAGAAKAAMPSAPSAPLKGYTAIIPAVDAPIVNWKPYLPATALAKLAAGVNLVISPALAQTLYSKYGVTADNLTGITPLNINQSVLIAKTAGLSQAKIDAAVKAQTLAQVAAQALAKASSLSAAETEALTLALAQTATQTQVGVAIQPQTSIAQAAATAFQAQPMPYPMPQPYPQPYPYPYPPYVTPPSIIVNPPYKPPYEPPPEEEPPPDEPDKGNRPPYLDLPELKNKSVDLRRQFAGAVAFKAGFGYWAFKEPYNRPQDRHFFRKEDLPDNIKRVGGGAGSGYASIQQFIDDNKITDFDARIGFEQVSIHEPSKEPGKSGAIEFKRLSISNQGAQSQKRAVNKSKDKPRKKPKIIISRMGRWAT